MTDRERRQRMASMLLAELAPEDAQRQWYYISQATEEGFAGGLFVHAFGPTDAFMIVHRLNLYVEGSETQTTGPILAEKMANVPADWRWRLLSREEVEKGANGD